MNKRIFWTWICLTLLFASFKLAGEQTIIPFKTPRKWPKPAYDFKKNPLTLEGFELGRKLFYDPIFSRDSTISCSSCHLQYTGFTHVDHAVSHGIEGKKGTRNSPVLINLAWNRSFHWDGGVNHIEVQALNPIKHPAEMDNTLEEVIKRLQRSIIYPALFEKAFGTREITTARIMKALTQYELSLVSANSKYDQVMRKEKGVSFSEQEKNGLELFREHCAMCHSEPLFTNDFFASIGLPMDPQIKDVGRYGITHDPNDSLLFKIPTLRNIEYTFPYMHDGRFKKLKEVLQFYAEEIDTTARNLHPSLRQKILLSENERKDIIAFLYTLTDKEFLFNKRFSFPK
jgi:cytochrome c peroxidase